MTAFFAKSDAAHVAETADVIGDMMTSPVFDPEEVEREKRRDPISMFAERCVQEEVLAEADIAAIEQDVAESVAAAVAYAEASPEPPPEWLLTDVYKE